jgi:hypothetical protein
MIHSIIIRLRCSTRKTHSVVHHVKNQIDETGGVLPTLFVRRRSPVTTLPSNALANVFRRVALVAGFLIANAYANSVAASDVFRVMLEEPVAGETHGGVGNLRGWAVSSEGIEKIEIWIDGAYAFDAPYGGARSDVGGTFPDVPTAPTNPASLSLMAMVI